MKRTIKGKAFVIGDNIDTDQIIPAKYLVYSLEKEDEKRYYGKYALSGVPAEYCGLPKGNIPFVDQQSFQTSFPIIIAGKNFGCGSSREHAPAALHIAGVKAIVAQSFARIFYRNTIDGGYVLPLESTQALLTTIHTGDEVVIDLDRNSISHLCTANNYVFSHSGEITAIIDAGGIFAYARKQGLIAKER